MIKSSFKTKNTESTEAQKDEKLVFEKNWQKMQTYINPLKK